MLQLGADVDAHIDIGDSPMVDEPGPSPQIRSPHEPERLSRPDYLNALGRASIAIGALILLFCGYQLWGSGLLEWQAQRALDAEFAAQLDQQQAQRQTAAAPDIDHTALDDTALDDTALDDTGADGIAVAAISTDGTTGPPAPSAVSKPKPGSMLATGLQATEGDPVGRIDIPAIDVTKTFVLGVERPSLRQGPGLYPTTAVPGQAGNTAIAGHRTTHGAPFGQIDQLDPGDEITVETIDGIFTYSVIGHARADGTEIGHRIVDPSDVAVIGNHGDNRLTLTACHPRFSARQRIIVSAALVGEPTVAPASPSAGIEPIPDPVVPTATTLAAKTAPRPEPTQVMAPDDAASTPPGNGPASSEAGSVPTAANSSDPGATIGADDATLDSALGWQRGEAEPTVLWATVFLLIGFSGWVLGRLWRRRLSYAFTTPIALVPLFICFVHLDRLLPAF